MTLPQQPLYDCAVASNLCVGVLQWFINTDILLEYALTLLLSPDTHPTLAITRVQHMAPPTVDQTVHQAVVPLQLLHELCM